VGGGWGGGGGCNGVGGAQSRLLTPSAVFVLYLRAWTCALYAAAYLGAPLAKTEAVSFADGETSVKFAEDVEGQDVVRACLRSLHAMTVQPACVYASTARCACLGLAYWHSCNLACALWSLPLPLWCGTVHHTVHVPTGE
jgi:hypothetical protein